MKKLEYFDIEEIDQEIRGHIDDIKAYLQTLYDERTRMTPEFFKLACDTMNETARAKLLPKRNNIKHFSDEQENDFDQSRWFDTVLRFRRREKYYDHFDTIPGKYPREWWQHLLWWISLPVMFPFRLWGGFSKWCDRNFAKDYAERVEQGERLIAQLDEIDTKVQGKKHAENPPSAGSEKPSVDDKSLGASAHLTNLTPTRSIASNTRLSKVKKGVLNGS